MYSRIELTSYHHFAITADDTSAESPQSGYKFRLYYAFLGPHGRCASFFTRTQGINGFQPSAQKSDPQLPRQVDSLASSCFGADSMMSAPTMLRKVPFLRVAFSSGVVLLSGSRHPVPGASKALSTADMFQPKRLL